MRYTVLFAAFVVLGIVIGGAEPLANFQFTPADGFTADITGGEQLRMEAIFENTAAKQLPAVAKIETNSSHTMTGEEFTVTAHVQSDNGNTVKTTKMSCRSHNTTEQNTHAYICQSNEREILSRGTGPQGQISHNTMLITMTAVPYILADTYHITLDIKSQIGVPGNQNHTSVQKNTPTQLQTENAEVSINATDKGNATIKTYTALSVPPPQQQTFVNGIDITITDEKGNTVEASGTITLHYADTEFPNTDESTLQIYYYNQTIQEWEPLPSTVNTETNTITTNVSHFSAYAAFGEALPTNTGSSGDTEDIGGGVIISNEESTETANDTVKEEAEQDESTASEPQEHNESKNETTQHEATPGINLSGEDGQDQPAPATGAAIASPTQIGVVVGTAVLLIGALIYWKREWLRTSLNLHA